MKKVLLCGFFILLSFTLAHGITCYNCMATFKDSCRGKPEKCSPNVDRCVTESVYSEGGEYRSVYSHCAVGGDQRRCGTTLKFTTEIQVVDCCYSDRCNGKRSLFPPPKCAKPVSG